MVLDNYEEAVAYKKFADKCRNSYQTLREKCQDYTLILIDKLNLPGHCILIY